MELRINRVRINRARPVLLIVKSEKFNDSKWNLIGKNELSETWLKNNLSLKNLDMFFWTSGVQNPLAQTHFNVFMDEC